MSYKSDLEKVTRTVDRDDFPLVLLLDNLNACNLKCSMCDHKNMKKYRRTQRMEIGLYCKIIDEVAERNPSCRVWEIFFGDPFLLKDMPERIQYAKDKGLTDVVLNTNGCLMSAEKSEAVISAGLDAIYVGIDAANEETYNKIRIGGDFRTTVQNVLKYRDVLKTHGNGAQRLYVQFVVSEFNEGEVEEFKSFWVSEGVGVKIRPKVSWGGLIRADNLRPNEEISRKPCYWLMQTMNICADGEATLCSVDVHNKVKCGNVSEMSLAEIWQGRLKELRGMHRAGRWHELPEMCRECRDWQSTYAEFY